MMLRSEEDPTPVGSVNLGEPLAKLHENDGFNVGHTLSLSTELVRRRPPPILATCISVWSVWSVHQCVECDRRLSQ